MSSCPAKFLGFRVLGVGRWDSGGIRALDFWGVREVSESVPPNIV